LQPGQGVNPGQSQEQRLREEKKDNSEGGHDSNRIPKRQMTPEG